MDFTSFFAQYDLSLTEQGVKDAVAVILDKHYAENDTVEVYKQCLNMIDLTTLAVDDTEARVMGMAQKVNEFDEHFPHLRNVAAICVYPAMVSAVKNTLEEPIGIASVAAGFPASQTFIEVKVAETAMAVMEGATEIDVVISVGKYLEGDYDTVYEELCELKAACKDAHLKVILETGALPTMNDIKQASLIAMQAGADFIKTSTGKIPVAATLEATYVMCQAIKEWNEKTGEKVGYKPAGGIVTTEDAVKHYTIVQELLGEGWLNNEAFRFGASRLANNLLSSIEGTEVAYF